MAAKTYQRQVQCENGTIVYILTRKPVKNVNLRIKQDGSVLVSANNRVPVDFIDKWIGEKQEYILSVLAKYEEKRKHAGVKPREYVSGEHHVLLGKNLTLQVEESEKEAVYTDGVSIVLKVKDKEDFRHKELMMEKWLKEYRKEIFKKFLDERYTVLKQYGVPYPELKVRRMTSCWGVCRPKTGVITLNSRLIGAPSNCIEYVVLHEFVHFIHPNHSRQFWDFVTMMMPDWKERKEELEKLSWEGI